MRSTDSKADEPQPERIEELFAALESPLLNFALRLTGDPVAAGDAEQEPFTNLREQSTTVREPRPWLYRTVHSAAVNYHRKSGKIAPSAIQTPGNPYATEVASDRLVAWMQGVKEHFGADPCPGTPESMIRQAQALSGR